MTRNDLFVVSIGGSILLSLFFDQIGSDPMIGAVLGMIITPAIIWYWNKRKDS